MLYSLELGIWMQVPKFSEECRIPSGNAMETRIMYGICLIVKIMVPFWIPTIIRPLIFRVPKKGP